MTKICFVSTANILRGKNVICRIFICLILEFVSTFKGRWLRLEKAFYKDPTKETSVKHSNICISRIIQTREKYIARLSDKFWYLGTNN